VKVREIIDGPDRKKYAYVEGDSPGAVAVEQLTVQPAPSAEPVSLPPNPFFKSQKQSDEGPYKKIARIAL
jgi:hypothetical protein